MGTIRRYLLKGYRDSRIAQELRAHAEVATTIINSQVWCYGWAVECRRGLVIQHLGAAKQTQANVRNQS